MSSSNFDPNSLATNVITYIGVPFAVLGILPIVYSVVVSLIVSQRIKSILKRNAVVASTRTDIFNRVVEVEFQRYAVTPQHNNWRLSAQRSDIAGGSWTVFQWQTQERGKKMQRVQYAEDLQQPQVEVNFAELIAYLHELGSVPDPDGWKRLRANGLWMPKGLPLMKSPDGTEGALVTATLEDSNGHLSLAATTKWSESWRAESFSSLPPYAVRIAPPLAALVRDGKEAKTQKSEKSILYCHEQKFQSTPTSKAIICEVFAGGISEAYYEQPMPSGSTLGVSIDITHLKSERGSSDMWVSSAVTATRVIDKLILWKYAIPNDVLHFVKEDTMPCGILVLLDIVDPSQTPAWDTQSINKKKIQALTSERRNEQRLARRTEARMQPEQRHAITRDRVEKERVQREYDVRSQHLLESEAQKLHIRDALQSPRWDASRVSTHCFTWLQAQTDTFRSLAPRNAIQVILYKMIMDARLCASICTVLDLWKSWAGNKGMTVEDLATLREDKEVFAQASLLLALISDAGTAHQDTMSDLQECLNTWKTVRFG